MDAGHASLSAESGEGPFGLLDGEAVGVQAFHGVLAGVNGVHGAPEGRILDAQDAAESDLLPDDVVRRQAFKHAASLEASQHHRAARFDHLDRLVHRLHGVWCGVDHAVHPGAAGGRQHALHGILTIHVDGDVGAHVAGQRQLVLIPTQTGDGNHRSSRFLGRDGAANSALTGTEHCQRLARLQSGSIHAPGETGAQRVEHHRHRWVQIAIHGEDHRAGRQIQVLGVTAPEAGRLVQAGLAEPAGGGTRICSAGLARGAASAPVAGTHRHAITDGYAPPLGRDGPDGGDAAQRLVSQDDGKRNVQVAAEPLVVGAADAGGLDADDGLVVADLGDVQPTHLHHVGRGGDGHQGLLWHGGHGPNLTWRCSRRR